MDSINAIVEETLSSLDNIKRATADPYLYTKLQLRIATRKPGYWNSLEVFFLRPSLAFSILLISLSLNVAMFLNARQNDLSANQATHSFSVENEIATSAFFDIENSDANANQ